MGYVRVTFKIKLFELFGERESTSSINYYVLTITVRTVRTPVLSYDLPTTTVPYHTT